MSERLSILRDIESPPGGWSLTVPETGQTITGPYAESVVGKVEQHMLANGIPVPPDFEEWIEDRLCRENPHGGPWCGQKGKTMQEAPEHGYNTTGRAKRFVRTMLHVIRERKFVSREEALRRAAICKECPLAGDISGCWGCDNIMKMAKRAFPENPIKPSKDKSYCLACGCNLAYKPWIPNDTLDRAETGDRPDYAPGCWRDELPPSIQDLLDRTPEVTQEDLDRLEQAASDIMK